MAEGQDSEALDQNYWRKCWSKYMNNLHYEESMLQHRVVKASTLE